MRDSIVIAIIAICVTIGAIFAAISGAYVGSECVKAHGDWDGSHCIMNADNANG